MEAKLGKLARYDLRLLLVELDPYPGPDNLGGVEELRRVDAHQREKFLGRQSAIEAACREINLG